jgi:Tfp pilus assembly protein PilF
MHRSSARGTCLLAAALALGALVGCATTGSGEGSAPKRADSKAQTAEEEANEAGQRARIHYDLGIDRMREGRNPEAIGELLQAVRLAPNDARSRLALAEAYRRGGRFAEAEEHLVAALQIKPDFQQAHLNVSALFIQLERYEEALPHVQYLLDDPTFPFPWRALTNMGWAQFKLGRLDEAARHLALAIDYKDEYWPARLNLGILEAERGNRAEAIQQFERVLESQPGPLAEAEVRFRLAELLVANGDRRNAIQQLTLASDLRPSGPWSKRSAEYLQSLY